MAVDRIVTAKDLEARLAVLENRVQTSVGGHIRAAVNGVEGKR
jgi:hypothetical protein